MSQTSPEEAPVAATGRGRSASRLLRRLHLYLGLFLVPWMLMYAVSTVVMNHRETVRKLMGDGAPKFVPERELEFTRDFPAGTAPDEVARTILEDLGLAGAHRVSGGRDGRPLVIDRQHPLGNRRLTWRPETGKLVIERETIGAPAFLERLHRRRGFQHPYALEDTWAFTVDLTVITMVFWALSGVCLWWELRPTRTFGTLSALAGVLLFAFFLSRL